MTIFLLLFGFSFHGGNAIQTDELDTISAQTQVELAVVDWANTTFIQHQNYLFKGYQVYFTDEYTIQAMRITFYEEKISNLKFDKESGTYEGTIEDFQSEIKTYEDAIQKVKNILLNIQKVDHYEIQFWSNIQCMDGITVYYELLIKIDSNMNILEAIENSSIGKKVAGSKIAYQPGEHPIRVLEK